MGPFTPAPPHLLCPTPTPYHPRPPLPPGPSTLLLNTQWGAVSAIAAVDVAPSPAGAARPPPVPLTPVDASAAGAASWSLLAATGGVAVAARAAPDGPTELYVAQLPVRALATRARVLASWPKAGLLFDFSVHSFSSGFVLECRGCSPRAHSLRCWYLRSFRCPLVRVWPWSLTCGTAAAPATATG